MLRLNDVICQGELGKFAGNSESLGWQGVSGEKRVYPASSVRRAEWSKGRLRLLCEVDSSTEVFGASIWFIYEKRGGRARESRVEP